MINLKKVEIEDLSLILEWFHHDHVYDVWFSIKSMTEQERYDKYYKRLNKDDIEMFIILNNNIKIGYIQTYILDDLSQFKINGLAKGIDLFIGDKKYLGIGLGPQAIEVLLENHVFDDNLILHACIDPEVRNERAIKAYKKVGFKHVNTEIDNYSKLKTYFMILNRNDFWKTKKR